ncbi:MAG TPA: hypothetical protein DCL86_07695 [Bacteroidales bacterium]|nr:hypothetical protein [Bacteroidales bacterium]
MKEITVFASGDSSQIKTWSHIPYFFTTSLTHKGIKVNRVSLKPNRLMRAAFDFSFTFLLRKLLKNTTYDYFRSGLHFAIVRHQIKKAIRQFPDSDAFAFLTFSFSTAGLSQKPSIQLCDWTYDYYFKYFKNRKPDFFEKQSIKREDKQIQGTDCVISLFPRVAEYMKARYGSEKVHYLGNVINALFEPGKEEIFHLKRNSGKLLFVGSKKYIEGAEALIKAFELLKPAYSELSLHLIGIDESDIKHQPAHVFCYGYLDKALEEEKERYYDLLKEARIFINTTPKWAAFSASIEAMYYYTPVVVPPYEEFKTTFGATIDFGVYCEDNTPQLIAQSIKDILNHRNYEALCNQAHESVKAYTWDAYTDKIIEKIEHLLT